MLWHRSCAGRWVKAKTDADLTQSITNAPKLSELVVFSDLDGTFLGHQDFDASYSLSWVRKHQPSLVFCTSKTVAEARSLADQWQIQADWICENGAVLLSGDQETSLAQPVTESCLEQFPELVGLASMSLDQQSQILGLQGDALARAMTREYSRLCLPDFDQDCVTRAAQLGYRLTRGGRVGHLSRPEADKGLALRFYMTRYPDRRSVALGDAPNDIGLFQAADIRLLINNPASADLMIDVPVDYRTRAIAPKGWVEALTLGAGLHE